MPNKCSSPSGNTSAPTLIEVAPGVFMDPDRRSKLPLGPRWLLLDDAGWARLGIEGLGQSQWQTVRRLWEAGFIRVSLAAPRTALLDMDSWAKHIARCAEDPWFWQAGMGNLEKIREAY